MINKKYLPSRKFVIALSIAIFVILVAIAASYIKPSARKSDDNALITENTTSSASEIDSDHDGLPDWEEALYGTDPHNPDTDGDGTNDGDEIKAGRDPLKANTAPKGQRPNDYIDTKIIAESNAISAADQNLNATEKMAHNLISNIIASQPVSGNMDSGTVNALAQQSLQDIPQKNFTGTTTIANLNLIAISQSTSTLEYAIAAYANSFYTATKPLQKILGEDVIIVNDSFSNTTSLDQKALKGVMSQYQTAINALIQMPLPAIAGSNGAIYHLKIVNDLEALVAIDNDIINSGQDSVNIYADLVAYSGIVKDLTSALSMVDATLKIKRQ